MKEAEKKKVNEMKQLKPVQDQDNSNYTQESKSNKESSNSADCEN